MSLPLSFPNQSLMDPELLKRLSSGYIIGPYAKTFPLSASVATMGTNDSIQETVNLDDAHLSPN